MMKKKLVYALWTSTILVAATPVIAQDISEANDLIIRADSDGKSPEEGIKMYVGGAADTINPSQIQMEIYNYGTIIHDDLRINGTIYDDDDDTVNIGEKLYIAGTTTVANGGLNVTGATNLNTGLNVDGQTTLENTTIVGDASITGPTTVVGSTSISGQTTIVGVTSINTTSGDLTSIGRSGNTTELLSNTVNVGTGNYATNVRIGGSTDGTTVRISAGGRGEGEDFAADAVRISAAGAESIVVSTKVRDDSQNTAILIEASNIAGDDEQADIDIIAADSIDVQAGDDFDVVSIDRTRFEASRFYVNVGDTGGNIGDAGVAIAGNGEIDRWIADGNGLIRKVTGDEIAAAGNTAAIVVTNPTSNKNHGLVVQETKTTLSGGINSGSMTLDDRGATFSNPADGSPIQVHGVADGTAPFDAVNVRQLYSGLAAVLASTPEIALAPGKTGMAVGLGGYGNYGAIGIGFGHMYENGTTLKASASKGQYSELAYRASVSWNW